MLRPRMSPWPADRGWDISLLRDMARTMSEQTRENLSGSDGRLLHAGDVAELLGVPTTWVYAEARAGRLPHVRVGRYRRFRRQAVEAWIVEHERGPRR